MSIRSTKRKSWNGLTITERSSHEDLAWMFRAVHQREYDPEGKLYCKASLALRRIKSASNAHDPWVWAVLAERLIRAGYPVDWMFRHTAMPEPVAENRGRVRAIYNNAFGEQIATVDDVMVA